MIGSFESAFEAAFEPVEGGYIFRASVNGLWSKPRAYRVTDAQKAELIALKRANVERWQPLCKILGGVFAALVAACGVLFALGDFVAAVLSVVGAFALLLAAFAVIRSFTVRAMAPILAASPPVPEPIVRNGGFERQAEAVRQVLEAMPLATKARLGSWFDGWKDSGTGGLIQSTIKTEMRTEIWVESWLAPTTYWLAVVVGLAMSGLSIWLLVHYNYSRNALLGAPLLLAAALLLYGAGWGWRWLWTGRTDHLFAGKTYTPPGRLDELRRNVASVAALFNF
jgi:hypothetical protein